MVYLDTWAWLVPGESFDHAHLTHQENQETHWNITAEILQSYIVTLETSPIIETFKVQHMCVIKLGSEKIAPQVFILATVLLTHSR